MSIRIYSGKINVSASDDGLNAEDGSNDNDNEQPSPGPPPSWDNDSFLEPSPPKK